MKITCTTQDGSRLAQIEIGGSATFGDLRAILSVEFKTKPENLIFSYKGDTSIPDAETLENQGVEDNDMILVILNNKRQQAQPPRQVTNPGMATLDGLLPPNLRGLDFARLFAPPQQQRNKNSKAIDENYRMAMEENPESFARVYMLYIDVEVNGVKVKAFVDSGAQTTIMSKKCAVDCGIINMVDPRFAGVAMGVGSATILGRVHLAPLKIGGQFYNASFSVLDQVQNVELLIGLDLLKRYQCNIDLRNDILHIGTTNQTVPFLSEAELPPHAKLK